MCRSDLLGRSGVEFLSPNNSVVVAHAGSSAFLSCRLTKSPSFGMVSTKVDQWSDTVSTIVDQWSDTVSTKVDQWSDTVSTIVDQWLDMVSIKVDQLQWSDMVTGQY